MSDEFTFGDAIQATALPAAVDAILTVDAVPLKTTKLLHLPWKMIQR